MKKHLQLIPTGNMSFDDWLKYRKTGIGASEVGTVMGLNPYMASIELFYIKIGTSLGNQLENIHTFMGKRLESTVADLWQYWGGSQDSMIYNFNNEIMIRRCQKVNAYVRNPRYPWLFVSLDRKININADQPEGALECKTISGYETDKWEGGIPPAHVVQVTAQTTVCEFEHGELATLKDGRFFDVTPFDHNKIIADEIIEVTNDFWQRVEKGRVLNNQIFEARRKMNLMKAQDLQAELMQLEPPPDNSEAYADFLKDRNGKSTAGERMGTLAELKEAQKHKEINFKIGELVDKKRLSENIIKKSMGEFERLNFGKNGIVTWRPDVNGSRKFMNKIKD